LQRQRAAKRPDHRTVSAGLFVRRRASAIGAGAQEDSFPMKKLSDCRVLLVDDAKANLDILVEGVSEQLLLPHLARLVGRDLADAGVSVINIGGVAFSHFQEPVARLGLGRYTSETIAVRGPSRASPTPESWKTSSAPSLNPIENRSGAKPCVCE